MAKLYTIQSRFAPLKNRHEISFAAGKNLNQDGHLVSNQFGAQIWRYDYISGTQTNLPDNGWNLMSITYVSNTLKTVNIENDRLISMLIHNLKNPIGISYSFSDMILAGIENYDAEKIQKHVQIIKNSSQYTIELLNSFSEYNQLKNSSTDYNFQLKNYNEVLNNVVNDFNEIAKDAKNYCIKNNIALRMIGIGSMLRLVFDCVKK